MKYAIGIDIGGTKISISLGDKNGKILAQEKIKTLTGTQTQKCLDQLIEKVAIILKGVSKKDILGIGVALPGPVNSKTGKVPLSPHLKSWEGIPLRLKLEKKFKLPVYLANDANSAAIAEKVFGQAKNSDHFIYMTVSTGVGGGIYANGRLLEGVSWVGGEIGHMTVDFGGDPWMTGQKGSLEAYSSGTAIAKYVKQQIKNGRGSKKIKKYFLEKNISAKTISKLAKEGDSLAIQAFHRAAKYLGAGMGNLLNILNPDFIIIGGGVIKSAPAFFLKDAKASAKQHSWPQAFKACKIVKSTLKGNVGDLGALSLVFAQKGNK